jgi:hypothetical protein
MGYWLFLGLSLAGCGVGALLTAVVYLTQLKKVKTDLQTASGSLQAGSQVAPDPKGGQPQRRSA